MSALDRMSPRQRRRLEKLAEHYGLAAEDLAQNMAAAYMQLVEDAPEALPGRPLLSLVKKTMGAGRG
ncbi:hypothetical protein [Roseovarius sp. C03]|uniref:hypothetical protein n=1 Tax=Roseovarius sp. C03 TaxID=3449222 RepID=UPI003EDBD16B